MAVVLAAVGALGLGAAPASASDVIVQGTTDVQDAGLLDDVIVPGFRAADPQYTLKYVAVGSGDAITNAEAGQGDVVLVHAPTSEEPFVRAGYSFEPIGRAIFFSDYVIVGPLDDPAGVLSGPRHDAARAYDRIARSGQAGRANFVSRGDESGTNTEEKAIWQLTKLRLNTVDEPGDGTATGNPSWYHKAGAGQAATLQITSQCPFTGGGCYEMTDRGTFNRLVGNASIRGMKVVADKNGAAAVGGSDLLINPYTAYAVSPAKVPSVNLAGAEAFLDYLTSPALQSRLASYPDRRSAAFHADARPTVRVGQKATKLVSPGRLLEFPGSLRNPLPGSPAVPGQTLLLERQVPARRGEKGTARILDSTTTDRLGDFRLAAPAYRSGRLRLEIPTTSSYPPFDVTPLIAVGSLRKSSVYLGRVDVRSVVKLAPPTLKGHTVRLAGSASPAVGRDDRARLLVIGRQQGEERPHRLRIKRPGPDRRFAIHLNLAPGRWSLRVKYRDPGAVLAGVSRTLTISVP